VQRVAFVRVLHFGHGHISDLPERVLAASLRSSEGMTMSLTFADDARPRYLSLPVRPRDENCAFAAKNAPRADCRPQKSALDARNARFLQKSRRGRTNRAKNPHSAHELQICCKKRVEGGLRAKTAGGG
jgi:hypothetical protein